MLQEVYDQAQNRPNLSARLDAIQKVTGFTRVVILAHAAALGISYCVRRGWSPQETELLLEMAGSSSLSVIARRLGRTVWSVRAKAKALHLTMRVSDHYTKLDLGELFGVTHRTISRWVERGWLVCEGGKITEHSVSHFLRKRPEQYHLRRVNEEWFKGIIFPNFGREAKRGMRRTSPIHIATYSVVSGFGTQIEELVDNPTESEAGESQCA
ncbi:MAG: hypothetical protein H0X25_13660 [Acidobacteriales bacterium]|nr:hypothetical protein [Terriglobales bacterium]